MDWHFMEVLLLFYYLLSSLFIVDLSYYIFS